MNDNQDTKKREEHLSHEATENIVAPQDNARPRSETKAVSDARSLANRVESLEPPSNKKVSEQPQDTPANKEGRGPPPVRDAAIQPRMKLSSTDLMTPREMAHNAPRNAGRNWKTQRKSSKNPSSNTVPKPATAYNRMWAPLPSSPPPWPTSCS